MKIAEINTETKKDSNKQKWTEVKKFIFRHHELFVLLSRHLWITFVYASEIRSDTDRTNKPFSSPSVTQSLT